MIPQGICVWRGPFSACRKGPFCACRYHLTIDEVRAIAAVPSRNAPTGVRNRSLVLLLASSGLRLGESLALREKDIDLEEGTLRVQRGKSGERVAVLGTGEAVDALARWIDHRNGLGIDRRRFLYCTLQGKPVRQSYIRALLPRLAARAGIEKRVHAHAFRHHFAVTLATNGTPIATVQALLGHRNLAVTSVYLERLSAHTHVAVGRDGMRRAWTEAPDE